MERLHRGRYETHTRTCTGMQSFFRCLQFVFRCNTVSCFFFCCFAYLPETSSTAMSLGRTRDMRDRLLADYVPPVEREARKMEQMRTLKMQQREVNARREFLCVAVYICVFCLIISYFRCVRLFVCRLSVAIKSLRRQRWIHESEPSLALIQSMRRDVLFFFFLLFSFVCLFVFASVLLFDLRGF